MTTHSITISNAQQLGEVIQSFSRWAKARVTAGRRVSLKVSEEKRSLPQNSRMWAMLAEVSKQVTWHGQKLAAEDWKEIFTASLKQQRAVPGIGGGFVILGSRTSEMDKQELSDLMELIAAFGAEHNVQFKDQ
jgi:hypothetical protein